MPERIKLTPTELHAQAAEMKSLEAEYSSLFGGVSSELNKVNSNWSANLAHNFSGKINSTNKNFTQITQELMNGAKVADTCAVTFESVDSQLAKVYTGSSSDNTAETGENGESQQIADAMKWAKGDWIDDAFADKPLWFRESLKESLKDVYKNTFGVDLVAAYDATQKLLKGDVIGALKKCANDLFKGETYFGKLETKFYINQVLDGVEGYWKFVEEPSFENLVQIGWNIGPKAVLETTSDAAWDVVKLIPGVSDWYEQHGATDAGGAFNTMYTEWTRVFFGDKIADGVSTYYADNGGLFSGLVNGGKEIANEVKKSCDKHGGIVGVWLSGWNSIFN